MAAHDPARDSVLTDLGWDPGWAAAHAPQDEAGRRPARVLAAHRDAWVVATADGDHDAIVPGRVRHAAIGPGDLPAVGDWVAVATSALDSGSHTTSNAGSSAVIHAVLPRRTAFTRSAGEERRAGRLVAEQVLAANVDVAFVMAGLDGDFNLRRLERYLAVAWSGGVRPVIVLNKADVATDLEGFLVAATTIAPGVEVHALSALTGEGVTGLAATHLLPGLTAVVLGSSGVGKSTLVNALLGREVQRTGPVRDDDGRGRHTTTHRELVRLPGGALLIDTPGMRSLGVAGASAGLEPAFADITALATGCRFGDCRHETEPGCRVRAALDDGTLAPERFESHRKLEKEAAHAARAGDRLLAQAERRRWRAIGTATRVHMQHKYGSDR